VRIKFVGGGKSLSVDRNQLVLRNELRLIENPLLALAEIADEAE